MSGPNQSELLEAAGKAADTLSPRAPADCITPCPLQKVHVIEAKVVDEQDSPIEDILVLLARGPEEAAWSKTDSNGKIRFEGLSGGPYKLALPEVDSRAWDVIAVGAADPLKSRSSTSWSQPPEPNGIQVDHKVEPGDCVASLAWLHGLLPDTIWEHSPNAALKAKRKHLHILNPGDIVVIPTRQTKTVAAEVDHRYTLRRKGVPERLQIRFLDFRDQPRKGVPYILRIEAWDGPQPVRTGKTDGEGYVRQPIPPMATRGEIVLGEGQQAEIYEFALGCLNPIDEISGVQARLNALRYDCGEPTPEMNDAFRRALRSFQSDYDLTVTGEIDGPTRQKLESIFGI